jgi:hypothetical protein
VNIKDVDMNKKNISEIVASQKFKVDKNIIKCLSVIVDGVKVDGFYNDSLYSEDLEPQNYYTISFEGIPIKVEKPEKAVQVKKQYIQTDRYGEGVLKHLRDLIELGVDRKELIEIISKVKIE